MKQILVRGGVYLVEASGATDLFDLYREVDTTQNLTSVAFGAQAVHYIKLFPEVSSFKLARVVLGYVDTAAADDLANVVFYNGTNADDVIQERKIVYATGARAETPTTAAMYYVDINPPIPVILDTDGLLYFKTIWSTAVINVGVATEFFHLEVLGYQDTDSWSS